MDTATPQQTGSASLTIEKLAEDQIVCLRFSGHVDESFDGKKISQAIKAQTLILDMGSIARISSFGLREWSDFIRTVEKTVKNIYLIECTPKVVDQLNMVANFAGKGLVYSFYAPYRCDFCDLDRQILFQVDRDRDAVRNNRPPEQPCEVCGNPEYLDEDPATFFSYLAKQPEIEIPSDVATFLSSKLGYSVSEAPRRIQVEKHVDARSTYLKLAGNLDGSFPREKIAEGLEGTIVIDVAGIGGIDPAGAAEWRGLIAMVGPFVERIYLLGCPPAFLERLARREDLGEDVEVLSFSMPYACNTCSTTVGKAIDVGEHYEILKFATPPEMKCDDCKSQTTCVASETLLSQLPALPQPTATNELRKFIKEAQQQQRRERAVAAATAAQAQKTPVGVPGYVTALLSVSTLAVLGLVAYLGYERYLGEDDVAAGAAGDPGAQEPDLTEHRPDWITTGAPGTAYCSDLINRLVCVGVSEYRPDRQEARVEANRAAKEELANEVGLKIEGDRFRDIRELYASARRDAVVAVSDAQVDDQDYAEALERRREGRATVSRALEQTGGAAVPGQPTDWYWEEYEPRDEDEDAEYLVFSRFDVSMDGLRNLVERYDDVVEVGGSTVLTAFPSLGWSHPELEAGAVVTEAGGVLSRAGVQAHDIVVEVDGEPVRSARDLAEALRRAGGSPQIEALRPGGDRIESGG